MDRGCRQPADRGSMGSAVNADPPGHCPEPRFTFIVAVYNVAAYLPEFLTSITALEIASDDLELIFVDDGATDESAAIIERWSRDSQCFVRLIRKANGGPASARNVGLEHARGRWISFPDPDDVLTSGYLRAVAAYIDTECSDQAAMLACRPIRFVDDTSHPIAPHPLDFKYADDVRLVDLEVSPSFVHLHTITSFYRAELIRQHRVRFDEAVRPVFEDAVFNVDYLSRARRPTIAFLGSASYYYRKRADQTSLTDEARRNPAMLTDLPENGYLAVLERSARPVPRWIQHIVFYDLQWLFRADARMLLHLGVPTPQSLQHLHDVLDRIIGHLDEATLLEFHAVDIPVRIRLGLVAAKGAGLPPQNAYVTKLDVAQRIMQISYFTDVAQPDEDIRSEGVPVRPAYAKSTSIRFLGRTWLYQRDVWLSSLRPVSVYVSGQVLPIVYGPPSAALFETSARQVWMQYAGAPPPKIERSTSTSPDVDVTANGPLAGSSAVGSDRPSLRAARRRLARLWSDQRARPAVRLAWRLLSASAWSARLAVNDLVPNVTSRTPGSAALAAAVRRRAGSTAVVRRFGEAWVLVDRDTSAQDNAEAFYRYLRNSHPDVNAWFALSPDSPDWHRLKQERFRLIEFGSIDYALALRNAKYLISSQADNYIVRPRQPQSGPRRWKFVFLQHGVIHNDLSRWLNSQPIRMIVTTTEAEHRSIVADGSAYLFSDKEVARTGLPRHDRLLAIARDPGASRRRTILIAPTWRQHLLAPQGAGHRRELTVDLAGSTFMQTWRELMDNHELKQLCQRESLELAFLAHPHLWHHVTADMIPPHVRLVGGEGADLQQIIAQARLLITDYSSIAFDVAYLRNAVIYYQFDAADFFSGAHTVEPGEFSYVRDGFGPVVTDSSSVVTAAVDLLTPRSPGLEEYRRRADATFTFRDGRCCERVYEAIRFREHALPGDLPGAAATADRVRVEQ